MMPTLQLIAVAQRPTSFGLTQGNLTVTLQDGDRTVVLPLPMHHYGASGVIAVPTATLNGSIVSLDLDRWQLYDLDADRSIGGLWFRNSNPGAPDLVQLVDRYVRDARHLAWDDLEAWVGAQLDATGREQR